GRVPGLDGGDELLLAVAEGGPVHLDLDVLVLRPGLDVLGDDVVGRGHEALEQPDAQLGLRLGVRHLIESLEPGGGPAGDDGGATQEFAAGDDVGVELLGEWAKAAVHRVPLWMTTGSVVGCSRDATTAQRGRREETGVTGGSTPANPRAGHGR